jgi:hypothetical protein
MSSLSNWQPATPQLTIGRLVNKKTSVGDFSDFNLRLIHQLRGEMIALVNQPFNIAHSGGK